MRLISVCLAAFGLIASSALAVPYASYIRVADNAVQPGEGTDITYVLNEDADTVTIELIPSGGGAAAAAVTYNSPATETTAGEHTVVWDGTDTFSGGSPISEESYRVTITVDSSQAVGWFEFASNRSLYGPATQQETLFDGYSGAALTISHDPSSEFFGIILASDAFFPGNEDDHSGLFPFLTTLEPVGDGSSDDHNPVQVVDTASNQGVWGTEIDPADPNVVWVVGQGIPELMRADLTNWAPPPPAINLIDADPTDLLADDAPRGVALGEFSGTRYLFIAGSNDEIKLMELDSNNEAISEVDILDTGVADRYSKDVQFDELGNLYWVNRRDTGDGTGGRLLRWDNATVAAAIADPVTNPLTDANADWAVLAPATSTDVNGVAFAPDGTVYLQIASDGIYEVDNISTATLSTTLTAGDLIIDFSTIGTGFSPSGFGSNLHTDIAGNIYFTDRTQEQIRAWSPGGAASITVPAPLGENLQVATVTSVNDWSVYE